MEAESELVDVIVELTSYIEATRDLQEYIKNVSLERPYFNDINGIELDGFFDATEQLMKRCIMTTLNYNKNNKIKKKKKNKKKIKDINIETK